jgi:hypothetical protein
MDPKPTLPQAPTPRYRFDDFVAALHQDRVYAHAIHRMVKWGRKGKKNEQAALEELENHVDFSPVLEELDVKPDDIDPHRCSNNTKFSMLDFSKYI